METSPDNVIILGAGASADAGIPMLRGFMDTMLELARRGRKDDGKISSEDLKVIEEGLLARDELDGYHGRVALDVWNIEDILSILAFSDRGRLEAMTKAIAKTIEFTCTIRHDWNLNSTLTDAHTLYLEFWRSLIQWSSEGQRPMPAILTFNYDLVLERSLFNAIDGVHYGNMRDLVYQGMTVDYSAEGMGEIGFNTNSSYSVQHGHGTSLKDVKPQEYVNVPRLMVKILKLHGSLNFPKPNAHRDLLMTSTEKLTWALDDPLILPPVFNKATEVIGKSVWDNALKVLRSCKNLIICGYSLPQTDIYMQYFLKAALGPNKDLRHIYVFDPVLFDAESTKAGDELRLRYSQNFSSSIQKRIVYQPMPETSGKTYYDEGKMTHFVRMLRTEPQSLLID